MKVMEVLTFRSGNCSLGLMNTFTFANEGNYVVARLLHFHVFFVKRW